MDNYEQLFARAESSLKKHRATWLAQTPEALIGQAKEIAALQDAHEYLAQGRGIDPEGVDYLLTLEDPLQAAADRWLMLLDVLC